MVFIPVSRLHICSDIPKKVRLKASALNKSLCDFAPCVFSSLTWFLISVNSELDKPIIGVAFPMDTRKDLESLGVPAMVDEPTGRF